MMTSNHGAPGALWGGRQTIIADAAMVTRTANRSIRVAVITLALVTCTAWFPVGAGPLELLETHCVNCHGGAITKGGLDLVTREGLLRGGESGETIVPGDSDASLLMQSIRHEVEPHMPYKASKLSDAAISQLADWVKADAPYSRPLNPPSNERKTDAGFTLTDTDRDHWAFQPIRAVPPPIVPDVTWICENPIDQFVLARLATKGLSFAPSANRTVLIRRVTLDLIGLPPTPVEIDAFINDKRPCAYERLIDRLLASPHYGERWGRHWLDLARYAETDGFEHDAVRPHSWRYRDYVIKSFNDDQPYDRFIREQLAGDELWPGDPEAITATGFNLLGPDMVDSSDQIQRRHNTLNDMTDTTALAFLGLTMGCARCHDHKFEPISQLDYYRLQAFFTQATFQREKSIPTPSLRAAYDAAMREYRDHPKMRELVDFEAPLRLKLFEHKVAQLSVEAQMAYRTPPEQRNAEQANLVLETMDKVKISEKEITAALSDAEKQRQLELQAEVKKLPKPSSLPKAMALETTNGSPQKTFLLHRGEYNQPGEEVEAGFPRVISETTGVSRSGTTAAATLVPGTEDKRVSLRPLNRADLANWIASQENPLSARVMVNRIWQHHFGRGLVSTPNDFGTHGQPPSHLELLDWLANEFIARGWSVKQMHRLMLTSATYRQVTVLTQSTASVDGDGRSNLVPINPSSITHESSFQESPHPNPLPARPGRGDEKRPSRERLTEAEPVVRREGKSPHPNPLPARPGRGDMIDDSVAWKRASQLEPDNRLYWRMNRLRLEGEVIRDSLLAVSGQLNPAMGGPGVFPPIPQELFAGAQGWSTSEPASEHSRRSLYIFARRNLRFPFLEVFDAPDSNQSCPVREGSTTAPQSLTLLNADEVTTAAKTTAIRIRSNAESVSDQIEFAYRLTLGRTPTVRERTLAQEFLRESPLDEFCRALFNLNEFVYVE